MSKSSKKTSGKFSSTGALLHASPVLSSALKSKVISSLKIPVFLEDVRQIEDVPVRNSEVLTPTNSSNKVFTINTGISEGEPTLVLSAEFLPIYDSGKKTPQGSAVSLKEGSKILTAKTSIAILSQSMDSRSAFDSNKKELKNYLDEEQSFITGLTSNLNRALNSLSVSSYSSTFETSNNLFGSPVSLKKILFDGGYNSKNVDNFTHTKLWHQALVETKRTLLTHSPAALSLNFPRRSVQNDAEPYDISDVSEAPSNLKRLWLNPYVKNTISDSSLRSQDDTLINVSYLNRYENIQFVNLKYANPLEKKITSVTGEGVLGKGNSGNSENIFFTHDEIEKLEESGKDISFLFSMLTKEALVSSYLTKQENVNLLSNRFGYEVNRSGDNFAVWDYLIGRVPKSVLEFYKTPLGNGNSLVSFSQNIVVDGNDDYRILTFENQYLEGTNTTPGSFYFVESSLNTSDGVNFDVSRLDDLIRKSNNAVSTVNTIVDLSGYDSYPLVLVNNPEGFGENYFRRSPSPDLNLTSLAQKFSVVLNTYAKCFRMSEAGIEALDTASMRPGLNFTQEETSGIRLASLICKTAVYPTQSYQQSYKKIKSYLFLWLMNAALGQGSSEYLEDLKKRISDLFSGSTVKVSGSDLQKAADDFRTVPIVIGSAPYIGDVPDVQSDDQELTDSVLAARRQAYNVYSLSAAARLFGIDENKGVWRLIIDSLKSVYSNSDLYFESSTAYSGIPKMYYMYSYFDLLLRVVAAHTPENLLGVYSGNYEYKSAISFIASEDNPDKNYYENGITVSETGFLIDKVSKNQLNDQFFVSQANLLSPSSLFSKKIADSLALMAQEEKDAITCVGFFKKYFLDLGSNLNKFRDFLIKNFQKHLDRMNGLYQTDPSIDSNQRSALLSLSFTRDQLRLTNYIMSEFSDRLTASSDTSSKLKSHPAFSSFVDNFMDFMPVNEVEIVSHSLLSSYFTSNELGRNKGNNKKIISVGLPPKLARSLVLTPANIDVSTGIRNSIIRLKVYKNDRLHPDVVYQPKTYLFEMGRFPTRVISNWDYDSLIKDSSNILSFPTKLMTPDSRILLHRDYTVAFPEAIYGNFLRENEKLEIYANHVISFLSEEYLRWFTDCRFDETRYNNYSQLTSELSTMETQFSSYIEFVKRNSATSSAQQAVATPQSSVTATYTDPASGTTYQIPVKTPQSSKETTDKITISTKNFVLLMNDTIRSYFMNETFLTDVNVFKRRMSYPKKFDRVFNVIVDPDDFYVDLSMTSSDTLDSLVNLGVLSGGEIDSSGKRQPYKNRDTSPQDVSLHEYFVTIEPYDYTQEEV